MRDSLLLPGGQITQKVFEPRYINMVQDCLAAQDRLIGVCIVDGNNKGSKDKFYNVGCAGKVTSFKEMVDGSFSFVLTGYCRFELGDEIPTMRKYRRFSVECEKYATDLRIDANTNINKPALIKLIRSYAEMCSISMDWDVLPDTPAFNIVTFFSMNLPFDDAQRQMLLEALTVEDRAVVLADLISNAATKSGEFGL
ncbi:MAG: peptidase [Rickettsiaceae bacterium]|nr:peptidase [Rickettsiaceae bacterium]